MADATSTVTIDTNEWIYVDKLGNEHAVTNGQTFNMTVSDDGEADVQYNIPASQSVTLTDGGTLYFRPETTIGNTFRQIHTLTDTGQGNVFHNITGELCIECPVTGVIQRWRVAQITPSDADFASDGTMVLRLEDQFGNVMVVPHAKSGNSNFTVGAAS